MIKNRNPYLNSKGKPCLRLSVVAFIDILGYKGIVETSIKGGKSDRLLNKIYSALKKSKEYIDHRDIESNYNTKTDKDTFAFKTFTDNIVVGCPIHSSDAEPDLGYMFQMLSYFQTTMTIEGFVVRGGIAIGNLFIDEIIVFGEGLIEAYKAEISLARDPRIILAKSAKDAVNHHLRYYGNQRHAPQVRDLLKDTDGQYFINYLDTIIPEKGYFCDAELRKHKKIIEDKLFKYNSKPTIWSKYMWIANYHNYYCRQNSKIINDSFLVNINKYKLSPSLLVD